MSIEIKGLHFAYPDNPNKCILNIAHWSAAEDHIFVHGPSGCGKSTLLNILSGMLKSQSGEINMLGVRLDQLSARARDQFRANHIGYVFQQFNLVPFLNAVENIQLATQFGKHKKHAASLTSIATLLDKLNIPKTDQQRQTATLSIGQQQRIAIARALINKPEILIVDEPTSALDSRNRDIFMSELLPLARENASTLIFVSHDMGLSEYFDRVDSLEEINQAVGASPCS